MAKGKKVSRKLLKPLNHGGVYMLPGEVVDVDEGCDVDLFLLENGIVEVSSVKGKSSVGDE